MYVATMLNSKLNFYYCDNLSVFANPVTNYGMHVRMLLHTQVHRAENTCFHNNNVYIADYATYIL